MTTRRIAEAPLVARGLEAPGAGTLADLLEEEARILARYGVVREAITALERLHPPPAAARVEPIPPRGTHLNCIDCWALVLRRSNRQKRCARCSQLRKAAPVSEPSLEPSAAPPPVPVPVQRPAPARPTVTYDGEEFETVWNGAIGRASDVGLSSERIGSTLAKPNGFSLGTVSR